MQAVTITQITPPELRQLIKDEFREFLNSQATTSTPPPAHKSEGYITEDEASKLIGGKNGKLSKVSMWKLRKNNVIQGYRIGRMVRYKESEILDSLSKINAKK